MESFDAALAALQARHGSGVISIATYQAIVALAARYGRSVREVYQKVASPSFSKV